MRKKLLNNPFRKPKSSHKDAGTDEHLAYINHSSSAVGWGTAIHYPPESWETYRDSFDDRVKDFISRAHPDLYNAAFFKEDVERHKNIALADAAYQRIANQRSIHNIRIYQDACLQELDLALHRMEQALAAYEEETKC